MKIAPRALKLIRRGSVAPVAKAVLKKAGGRLAGTIGIIQAYNVARAVREGKAGLLIPRPTQYAVIAGSPFGIRGAIGGGLVGAGVQTAKAYFDAKGQAYAQGKDIFFQGYDYYKNLKDAPYTPANPILAGIKNIIGGNPPQMSKESDAPYIYPTSQEWRRDYEKYLNSLQNQGSGGFSFTAPNISVESPNITVPVQASGQFDFSPLTTILGLLVGGGAGYALAKRRKKYKRRKPKK